MIQIQITNDVLYLSEKSNVSNTHEFQFLSICFSSRDSVHSRLYKILQTLWSILDQIGHRVSSDHTKIRHEGNLDFCTKQFMWLISNIKIRFRNLEMLHNFCSETIQHNLTGSSSAE